MKTYHIACMVTHSGRHLETEVAAYTMCDALMIFHGWLISQGVALDALSELDASEVVQ
jgi:hypothetical protein